MSFSIPIATIRSHIATATNTALSLSNSADITYYPDREVSQEMIDKALTANHAVDYYGLFFVIIPGINPNPQKYGSCERYRTTIPVEITICRRVDDNPHRQATTILEDGSKVFAAVDAIARPWSSTSYITSVTLLELTTRFQESERLNAAGYGAVRLTFELLLEMN